MQIYRVTFIGHRCIEREYELENKIEEIIKNLIRTKEYVEIYMGRNGDFDISAASAVKRAQKALGKHNSSLILVEPYSMKNDPFYEKYYDEVILPIDNKIHPKAAITKRNQWMLDQADFLICFVTRNAGGAYAALKYAEKQKIGVFNLATIQ